MKSYASFQRQLNFYGFHRIREGPNKGAYCHKLFQQGKPHLLPLMKRQRTIKKSPNLIRKVSASSSSNGYSMPSLLLQEQGVSSGGGTMMNNSNPFKQENTKHMSPSVNNNSIGAGHLLSLFQAQQSFPTNSNQHLQLKDATPTMPQPLFDYFEGRIFYFIPDDQLIET